MLILLVGAQSSFGQSLWEVTPYKIHVWIHLQSHPEIPRSWNETLSSDLQNYADVMVGSPWELTASVQESKNAEALLSDNPPDAFDFLASHETLRELDKFLFLDVRSSDGAYELTARELDVNTRVWSQSARRRFYDAATIGSEAIELCCQIFAPLVQIIRVDDMHVTAQVRAGAIAANQQTSREWRVPTLIDSNDVLLPYIRKKDRSGKVPKDGVNPVRYTVMVVKNRNAGGIDCETFSGYNQPFNIRRSSRTQQLAMVARSSGESTMLRVYDRKNAATPLIGYQVFARRPGDDKSTFVGRTDWRGLVEIPKAETTVRILFIKSGAKVVAKLPVVPGLQPLVEVALRNDEGRLEAEGFLLGIQENLVDLVARREILAVRIQDRIEKKNFKEADELLQELRRLPTQEDFEGQVQRRKQLLSVDDSVIQDKIDKLFADTRSLFAKFLDPRRIQDLQNKLNAAKTSGSASSTLTNDALNGS